MAFDGVPYAVEHGARTTAAVARAAHYAATGGAQGITRPGDLKVTATTTPSQSVNIAAGSATVLNQQAAGESYQGLARGVTGVDLRVTGSARTDLIVGRIVDPDFAPWQPSDVPDGVNGPYWQPHVIEGVSAGTQRASDVVSYSAVELARVAVPATGNITNSMITDLRRLAQARSKSDDLLRHQSGTQIDLTDTYATWPNWQPQITVPEWATHMVVAVIGFGVLKPIGGDVIGDLSLQLNGAQFGNSTFEEEPNTGAETWRRTTVAVSGERNVASLQGEAVTLRVQGRKHAQNSTADGTLRTMGGTNWTMDVRFVERIV